MTILPSRKNSTNALSKNDSTPENLTRKIPHQNSGVKNKKRNRGNIFFALFAAVAMVGAVGYGFNTVIRGPISSMSDVTRRTITENFVITASRVAIVNATTQQAAGGDCDADGMIEPLPWRDPAGAPAPVGGGLLPLDLVPDTTDPWQSQYGYCAWDTGSLSVSDAVVGCGGATPRRLEGSPDNNQYAIAVISAGKDRKFQTSCNNYVDTTPADNLPDSPLLTKIQGSDDIVLGYTYAEANDLGNGLWKEKVADPTTLQTDKNVESTGGATFADKVVLTGNTTTGGGLVLPSDPGDDSLSGPCNSTANDRQMRLNTSTTPPTLEICNWNGGAGLGWTAVSGGSGGGGGGPADCSGLGDEHYNDATTGHCYFKENTPTTSALAQTACTADGAYLAVPSSSAENDLLDANFTFSTNVWIGLGDATVEGDWRYMYGELANTQFWSGNEAGSVVGGQYNAWWSGTEPNNDLGNQDCAVYQMGDKKWDDTACGGSEPYFCEKTGTPAAAPTGPADCTGLGEASYNDASTGHCYFRTATTYDNEAAAQAACVADGGYLAVPSSSTENGILRDRFTDEFTWIGVKETGVEGDYEYSYGELAGTQFWTGGAKGSGGTAVGGHYNNFEPGEPDNFGGTEGCGAFSYWGVDDWLDIECTASWNIKAMCEKTGTGTSVPSPVSRWKLNESSGTTVADSVGSNNGTFNNTPVWEPTGGANGGSLRTAAAGNHTATVPRAAALEPTAFTISSWIKPTATTGAWQIAAMKTYQNNLVSPNASYALAVDGIAGSTYALYVGTASGFFILNSPTAAPLNTWTHVTGTYDPNASAPQAKLYINGVLVHSETQTDTILYDTATPSGDFHLGREGTGNNEVFTGSIDDVRVYNRVLTADQILDVYNATKPPAQNLQIANRTGKLFSWGSSDTSQQLGNGTSTLSTAAPYAMINGDDFVQVVANSLHGCGLKDDGTVWCWGSDLSNQLGNGGTTGNQGVMTQAVGITNAVKVTASLYHSCALLRDGKIMCWGSNTSGQLGTGDTTSANAPVRATTYEDFVDVATTYNSGGAGNGASTCGLRSTGAVLCWGEGSDGQLGNGASADSLTPVSVSNVTDFVSITGSPNQPFGTSGHFCGVAKSGTAYCWGTEKGAEFGNGATGSSNVPSPVSTYTDWVNINTYNTVTCGVRANGLGYCWGTESSGNLGNGTTAAVQATPVPIDSGMTFKKIVPGGLSSCGIATNNTLYCWGTNSSNQLGVPSLGAGTRNSPTVVNGRNVIDYDGGGSLFSIIMDETATDAIVADKNLNLIGAGDNFACSIIRDGGVACWGDDGNGELGNGALPGSWSPSVVNDADPWMQIAVNPYNVAGHVCGIKGDGSAWCWGEGSDGQIGDGGTADQTSPVRVSGGATRQWSQISTGVQYTCGIETDGDLYCWGVGFGTTPVLQSFGKTWSKISTGYSHTCGIDSNKDLWCWGDDTNGQLGNGASVTGTQANPYKVASNGPWVDISTGPITCGIKANGSLWCWGDLAAMAITGWDNTTPQLMMDIGPWVKVKTNFQNVCGIKADGSLWCFGEGSLSLNGNNSATDFSWPQPVRGSGEYIDIALGINQACAMRSDYTTYCWNVGAPIPGRVELTPTKAGFSWNTAETALIAGLSSTVGTSRWISDDGAANKGLNLGASGRAQIRQTTTGNQLFIETKGTSLDAQVTLRAPSAVAAGDVQDGLIRHFKLDETTGSTITDSEGGGNGTWADGSGNSVAQETAPGINGSALQFDGTDDRISVSNFTPSAEGTVSLWAKFDDLAENRMFGGNTDFEIMLWDSTDSLESDIGGSGGPTTGPLAMNTWYHIVVTYNAASSSLYLNGVLKATVASPVIPAGPFTLYIGDSDTGSNHDGAIDDVRIYNRVLDPGEIAQLYLFTQTSAVTRSMGVDATTGNFEIARNNSTGTGWLSSIQPDVEISEDGYVGIGTSGTPASKLDVNGAIKVGNEATCNGAAEGTIRWTGTTMEYCDGTWQPLTSANTGGGGNGGIVSLWNTMGDGGSMIRGNGTGGVWGYGGAGRLGNNSTADLLINESSTVCGSAGCGTIWADWVLIASGNTSCGIRTNGGAWCWGYGEWGQMGDGDYNDFMLPVAVRNTADTAEWYDWVHVQTGGDVSCGIRATGTAYCWGNAGNAELGNGATSGLYPTPQPVHSSTNPYTPWTDWKTVEPYPRTVAGIRANGEAYAWGYDVYGLGNQPSTNALQPRPLVVKSSGGGAQWTDWKDISAGAGTICGIRANGLMYCWGEGASGQSGDNGFGTYDYPNLTIDSDCSAGGNDLWVDVSTGADHTCAIKAGGTMWCWGRAVEGQTGNNDMGAGSGDGNNGNNYCMHQVLDDAGGAGWSDWVSVRTPWNNTCGMRANGTVWCWGEGASTSGSNAPLPVQVQ